MERWGWGVKRVWVDRGAVLCAGDSTWGPAYVVLRGAMALGNDGGVLSVVPELRSMEEQMHKGHPKAVLSAFRLSVLNSFSV